MDSHLSLVRKELENKEGIIKLSRLECETSLPVGRGILKGKLVFIDDSVLYFNEFLSSEIKRYRFHYMDSCHNLIMRWDSAPHHKEIDSFPYHLHTENKTLSSPPVTFIDVLKRIEEIVLESLKKNEY